MNKPQHIEQSQGAWHQKSFLEQMANIGSEVYRAITWKKKNKEYSHQAFDRSLELFDLTKNSKLSYAQYKELTRMREIWVDYYEYGNSYHSTEESINAYFRYLTIAYQRSHG